AGQQPGAVGPPVDRDLCAVARQPGAAERAPAPALIAAKLQTNQNGGAVAPPFFYPYRPGRLPSGCPVESSPRLASTKSAQELENALLRRVGERQRGYRDRLAGRHRLAARGVLVGIGQRQDGRAGLQHGDQLLREVLTD